jgi:predicted ATPase/DNA-binding CsgD family transcriptional regulator
VLAALNVVSLELLEMGSTNLQVQLTSFIGREQDLSEISRLIGTIRLVTLTGAGGCGKTRLALHTASALSEEFSDGVWLVDLVMLREPSLVPQLVAHTLGIHEVLNQSLLDSLLRFVQSKHMLVILDNCEHLSDACAALAQSLLSHAPRLHILTTSREPLAVEGETTYYVTPLTVPPDELLVEEGMHYDAVKLFVERTRAALRGFALTAENAAVVSQICRRLDGIPLAIELASARVRILSLDQIAARLGDRFSLLVSDKRGGQVPHHQTLRATMDWSYALLTPAEQTLLRRLAVFGAGFSLDMVESICSDQSLDQSQILSLLSSLIDKSLVVAETLTRAQAHYRLLETVREYALEKLNEAGETAQMRDRHLEQFVARAEEIEPKLAGAYQQLWMNWLESDLDNLRAALGWSQESGRIEAGLRLANAISEFWWFYGHQREGRVWYERLLALASDEVPVLVQASANSTVTHFSWQMGDHDASKAQAEAAIAMADQAGEMGRFIRSFSMLSLSLNLRAIGEYAAAFDVGQQSLEIMREVGHSIAEPLAIQGINAMALGKYDLGRSLLDESLTLTLEQGNTHRAAGILKVLGDLMRREGDYTEAQSMYQRSLSIYRELDTRSDAASVLCSLAHTHLQLSEIEQAAGLLHESLALQRGEFNERGLAECLLGFGALAAAQGAYALAVRLLTAASTWSAESILNTYPGERMVYEKSLATAQSKLAERVFLEVQYEGRTLTIDQGIELAESTLPEAMPPQQASRDGLTTREREIAALIAQGRSNGEIADALVLSKRTVEKHIANILSKLELSNRAQVVRWAMENDQIQTST